MAGESIGLGWRVHSWSAVVVAVTGSATAPEVIHREVVTLVDDESAREPYHAAVMMPVEDVPAFVDSVQERAAVAAAAAIEQFASTLGAVGGVGVVGGNRKAPTDLRRVLASHARIHAAERLLYEDAVVDGATRAGLPVTMLPATGSLLDDASRAVGTQLAPLLATVGKTIGKPWDKDHREATAAALVALSAR